MKYLTLLLGFFLLFSSVHTSAQRDKPKKGKALVFVDKNGVIRWTADGSEASFFGVNYTTPFAYAYRAHKALGVDLEKAIQQDVYHMSRLGLDAFRVHVWDNEISDVSGNLLDNEHLRLFDFLLAELKKRGIKTILTPIAFWGNGYPERDEAVPGFSRFYGRSKLTTNDSAITAQENYLRQFFKHTNPYTKLTYHDDPDVIAVEINNEPSHSGPKSGVTAYINRLAAAIRSTGWEKPVFYNISQGPFYADAVAASRVDGFSFQWYPSGLVAGSEVKGNFLPHVDKYAVPFDTIPSFSKKALMVYEFDAADILRSYLYPAMARSFRSAGFQWATQFAYDPMAIAHANTEYQTHYLNLAYTPSKAISFLIASRVFHQVPRLKKFPDYPADSTFAPFRVSYKESLSEMNTEQEFYHSNSTNTKPVNARNIRHIAGVGNSPVVKYDGSGIYFLDKLEDGVWRLEVMPDAIHIRDPFERASPKKEVTRIQWTTNAMKITLDELGSDFTVRGLNEGNSYSAAASGGSFQITPGSYAVTRIGKRFSSNAKMGAIQVNEFVAPKPVSNDFILTHEPLTEVSAGKTFVIKARVVGLDTGKLSVAINRLQGQFRSIPMVKRNPVDYEAEVPAEFAVPGRLDYRIIMRRGGEVVSFPGSIKSDPQAWDNYQNETWKTFVANEGGGLELFNPTVDRTARTYPVFRRGFQSAYVTGDRSGQLVLRLTANSLSESGSMGFQFICIDKLKGRKAELDSFDKLVIRAKVSTGTGLPAKVSLVFSDGSSVSATTRLGSNVYDREILFRDFTAGSSLLMPRPYPSFQPLSFKGKSDGRIRLTELERIEVTVGTGMSAEDLKKPAGVDIESIWLEKATKLQGTSSASEIIIMPYRTTINADGKDVARMTIRVVDKQNREVTDADNLIQFYWKGDARIIRVMNDDPAGNSLESKRDSVWQCRLFNGKCEVMLQAGTRADKIKFEAKSRGLVTGSTGIHSIHPGKPHPVLSNAASGGYNPVDMMIGADISFLPQLEDRGLKFTDKGSENDPMQIMKDHGFNYVRLRIFHSPATEKGYSPKKGFCDLEHTKQMAKRVKAAGMKLLLDFHYSDYWADPEKQFKPAAWNGLGFQQLLDSVETYTRKVIRSLKDQGTPADMVQIGNEINHGMIWPEGHIGNLDSLAQLIQAGILGVKSVTPDVPIMLHIALGGQHEESVFFLDNMIARNIQFDVIGMSYYPKWQGTLDDLKNNMTQLANKYSQDIILVEYSQLKREVHEIVYNLPNGKGKGTVIWEPLNTWESIFDKQGNSNEFMAIYDEVSKKFIARQK